MNEDMHLTQAEINEICKPLKQASAQCRYLKSLGVPVLPKRNRFPLVLRSEWIRIMSVRSISDDPSVNTQTGPDVQGLMKFLDAKKNGKKTQGQRPGPAPARLS